VREPARRYFEHYANQERMGAWLPPPSPNIDELSLPIRAAMEAHSRFKDDANRFFGSKQLMRHPWYQSCNLLRIAVDRDSVAAVAWYHKVHSTERAKLAARIRQKYPTLIVIVTSAHFDDPEWSEPVVSKPYSLFQTAADLAERALRSRQNGGDL
jgi:hypothetical protein